MARTTKDKSEPLPESTSPFPEIPQPLQGLVDEMAWDAISKLIPFWVKGRIAFLLQSDDPEHIAKRQEIFRMLQDAIFAQALAGAGLKTSSPGVLHSGE